MQYTDPFYFLFFLPIIAVVYYKTSRSKRWLVLLIASYLFFFSLSRYLLIYLLGETLWIYILGKRIGQLQDECKQRGKELERKERKVLKQHYQKREKRYLVLGIVGLIGLLVILKYSKFLMTNMNYALNTSLPVLKFMVPIGLSFYTLQGVSYLVDIYRGKIKSDDHIGRVALYMSFFPHLMEGPICRYDQTAMSLYEGQSFNWMNIRFGMQRILYGLMKKIVIADRLNPLIVNVFKNYSQFDGGMIALGMVCYTCQLYMEFSGTIDIVIGSAQIFGITLPENFRQPFFSKSISEFWTRWHITLGTWFKDYIYYPMSLSAPLKKLTKWGRKHIGHYYGPLLAGSVALFSVWLCNGLWHGDAWSYIFFGMYHFALILTANICLPLVNRFYEVTHINKEWFIVKVIRNIKTVIFVFVGELFFRAHGLKAGLLMFFKMVQDMTIASFENLTFLKLGIDKYDFGIVIVGVIIVLIIGIIREKHIPVCLTLEKKPMLVRWAVWFGLVLFILIFGAYGTGYVPVDPIYAGF